MLVGGRGVGFGVKMDSVIGVVGKGGAVSDVVEDFLEVGTCFEFNADLVCAVVVVNVVSREVGGVLDAKGGQHQRGGKGLRSFGHELSTPKA